MEQKMREAELIAVKLVKESDRRWALLPRGCRERCFPQSRAQEWGIIPEVTLHRDRDSLCLVCSTWMLLLHCRSSLQRIRCKALEMQERSRIQKHFLFSVIK